MNVVNWNVRHSYTVNAVMYNTVQKFGISNAFINQGCIQFIKSKSEEVYNVTKE